MFSKNKEKEGDYFEEALSWETDRVVEAKKSKRLAWRLVFVSWFITFLSAACAALMLPLKETVPYVVKVDQTTGMVDIIKPLKAGVTGYDEVTNKYWIAHYLRHRERYIPNLYLRDYYLMGLTTTGSELQDYINEADVARNSNAPRALYGKNAEIHINIKNISFLGEGTALVRYSKTLKRAGGTTANDTVSHWIAAIDFEFRNASMKESDRLLNPLGFLVLNYRNDPEVIN